MLPFKGLEFIAALGAQGKDGRSQWSGKGWWSLDNRCHLWKTEAGELLQQSLKVADTGNCNLCAYNEVHKHRAILVCIATALQTTLS